MRIHSYFYQSAMAAFDCYRIILNGVSTRGMASRSGSGMGMARQNVTVA